MTRTLAPLTAAGKTGPARLMPPLPLGQKVPNAPARRRFRAPAAARALAALCLLLLVAAGAPPAFAQLSAADVAIGREALKVAENDRHDEALRIAARARDRMVGKIVRWIALAAPGSGFEEIAAFIRENGDWPNMSQLRRQAEKAMPIDLDESRVLEWFRLYPPVSVDGAMHYVDTLLATGGTEQAVKLIRERWVDGGFGTEDEQEFLSRYRSHLRRQDHVARLDRLLWERQEAPARRMAALLGDGYDALATARLMLDSGSGNVDAAVARVPDSLRDDPGLLYDRARWRRRQGDDQGALEILMKPPRDLGRPGLWWAERHILVRRAIERGDHAGAYRIAAAHRQEDGVSHADAEFLAGWLALRFLDRPSDAFAHFHTLYRSVSAPISKARGAYWCGRAAEALGDREKARSWFAAAAEYGTTFYGQLAVHHLGGGARPRIAPEPQPTKADQAAFDRRELVRAARILAQIEGRDADRLIAFLRRLSLDAKSPAEYALAARLARELGRRDLAVAAAKDAAQNDVFLTETGYPVIDTPRQTPEVALVHGIIRQESTFNTNVVSSAGARGLMQLMPATAKLVAKQIGVRHTHQRLVTDPAYNVTLGSAYMADLLDRFNGSYILAIASYNAGPGRVRGWLDQFGDPRTEAVDPVDWIELIPISETRNYVQRVMEATIVYRARLQGGRAELDLEKELRR